MERQAQLYVGLDVPLETTSICVVDDPAPRSGAARRPRRPRRSPPPSASAPRPPCGSASRPASSRTGSPWASAASTCRSSASTPATPKPRSDGFDKWLSTAQAAAILKVLGAVDDPAY